MLPVLKPPPRRANVPLNISMLPVLLNAAPTTVVPISAVFTNVPEFLKTKLAPAPEVAGARENASGDQGSVTCDRGGVEVADPAADGEATGGQRTVERAGPSADGEATRGRTVERAGPSADGEATRGQRTVERA